MKDLRSEPLTEKSLAAALDELNPGVVFRNDEERLRQRCIVRMLARVVTFGVTRLARAPYPSSTFDIRDAATTGRFALFVSTGYGAIRVTSDLATVEVCMMRPFDGPVPVDAVRRYAENLRDLADLAVDLDRFLTDFHLADAHGHRDSVIIASTAEAERQRALLALDIQERVAATRRGPSCEG